MKRKSSQSDRLWIEEKNDDFPFYNHQPIIVSAKQWSIILGMTFVGFLLLSLLYLPFLPDFINLLLASSCLPLLAWLGLKLSLGEQWRQLFRPLRLKDIGTVLLFTLLSLLVSSILAGIADLLVPLSDNPDAIQNTGQRALELFAFSRLQDIIQLFGEEFLAILPFLACLQFLYQRDPAKRKQVIWLAVIASSLIFGLLHLPTYNWNLIQCLLVIGLGRVIDTLAYVRTKNLWVAYLVHLLYDTVLFTGSFLIK